MAFDGITVAALADQLTKTLVNGRIYKIAQPENDELILTIKNGREQYRLLISAGASLPLVYLTSLNKPSPMTAPGFCMLLRKHLQNGRILSITQPDFERVLNIEVEHLDELGDLCRKFLIVEIMGKHSNIIFCKEDLTMIDSIKHISTAVSSVREVLPGRPYFIPKTQAKINPLTADKDLLLSLLFDKPMPLSKAVYTTFTGLSPAAAEELCYQAGLDSALPGAACSAPDRQRFFDVFSRMTAELRENRFYPCIAYSNGEPKEFSALPLTRFPSGSIQSYPSISEVLEEYYARKNAITRIRQRSADLRRIVQTALERNIKKYDLQEKQLKDTEKMEKYKIFGELLHTYGYDVKPGSKFLEALNYYTNETVKIPLDDQLTPLENAKKYFERYGKLKRTRDALSTLIIETKSEVDHLESIAASLDIALSENDLSQIKEELIESGYIRRRHTGKKVKITSKPFHYLSSDGFHIYVGKNNYQNEDLTFKLAEGNDWWFHAKGLPGSHVIVKTNNKELPDRTFEEAARLAGYYSKGRGQDKVEIDYLQKKQVKKPGGGKPGFVIYHTNYSMIAHTDIRDIKEISD